MDSRFQKDKDDLVLCVTAMSIMGETGIIAGFWKNKKNMKIERVIKAIQIINKLHDLEDAVYDVRAALDFSDGFQGNSWDHPRVIAYSDAVKILKDEKVIP